LGMVVESFGITYINLGGRIEKMRKGEKGERKREWDVEGEKGWNSRNLCIWAISAAEIDDVMYYKHVPAVFNICVYAPPWKLCEKFWWMRSC